MTDTLVILGGVVFTDFAIPDKINFGGKQTTAIHRYIGGARTVDAMGADPDPITWSGRFRGGSALGNAFAVDAMRQAGVPVSLSWLGINYTVLVTQFKADTEKYYEIPYTVTCEVVTDPQAATGAPLASLTALVNADMTAALAVPQAASLPAVLTLNTLIAQQATLNGAPLSVSTPIAAAVGAAQAAIAASSAANDAVIAAGPSTGCAGVLAGPGTAINSAAAIQAQIAAFANEAALQNAYALVTRVGTNVTTGTV